MEVYDVFVSVKPKPKQPSKVRELASSFATEFHHKRIIY